MNPCRICGLPRPPGYTATCGRSYCQQADCAANRARAARRGSKAEREALAEHRECAERAYRHSTMLRDTGSVS